MTEPTPTHMPTAPRRGHGRLVAAMLGGALALLPGAALADYWVYCINGTVRVESRPPADVYRSHIAGGACSFGQFRHVSDARGFSQRNFGGEGRSCSCR